MPFEDTIASIPQSDTDRIARRLLGDDLVDKFGDAIGARPHTMRDFARDFALGVAGGPTKSLELRTQVQEQFREAYTKEARLAAARQQEDRERASMVIDSLKTVSGLPPGHRAAIFQETLDRAGIPYSKAAVKFLTDADVLAQLPMGTLAERVAKNEVTTASIGAVLGSAQAAARWYSDMTRAEKDREQTGNMILDAEMKRLRLRDIRMQLAEKRKTMGLRIQSQKERLEAQKLANQSKRKKLAAGPKGLTGIPEIDAALAQPPAQPAAAPVTPGIKSVTQVQ